MLQVIIFSNKEIKDYKYNHFKVFLTMIEINMSKQQYSKYRYKANTVNKAIQQVIFIGKLENNVAIFFIIQESKEPKFVFSKRAVIVL